MVLTKKTNRIYRQKLILKVSIGYRSLRSSNTRDNFCNHRRKIFLKISGGQNEELYDSGIEVNKQIRILSGYLLVIEWFFMLHKSITR